MFRQEYIETINETRKDANRESLALFAEGNEEQIMLLIEQKRQEYLVYRENGEKVARERNLKRLKEYGESQVKPQSRLIENHKPGTTGKNKRPQTKDEKLAAKMKSLGLGNMSPVEFMRKLEGK